MQQTETTGPAVHPGLSTNLQNPRSTDRDSYELHLPRQSHHFQRRRLAGGMVELTQGTESLGNAIQNIST
jgi:hypothetical protein